MRKLLLPLLLAASLTSVGGCGSNHPVRRVEAPVNVTHEIAFGDYRRVYNTAYHILNRYGVVQKASYRYGEITALVSEDNSFFDKTRKTIQARIFDAGDYWEVECRVLISVEDSEPATFQGQFHPRYNWKTVASDARLEVRLNNEIRGALTGGAWKAKQPLTPKPTHPYRGSKPTRVPSKKGKTKKKKAKGKTSGTDTDEVSDKTPRLARRGFADSAAFERLGILRMRRGAFAGAGKAFAASIRQGKDLRFAHFLLAQAQFSQGKYQAALTSIQTGSRHNPDWPRANVDVRSFYGPALKTFPQRLKQLSRAAKKSNDLYLLLGYMRFYAKDAEGALTAFDSYLADHKGSKLAKAYRALARKRVDAAHGLEDF